MVLGKKKSELKNVRPTLTYSRRHDPLIVVRVDTHVVSLEVERILAVLDVLQLILMQVGPAPQAGVDNMGEAFTPGNLVTKHRMNTGRRALITLSSHYRTVQFKQSVKSITGKLITFRRCSV